MTVAELAERLSAEEWEWWIVRDSISPVGDLRADYHDAHAVSMLANIHRDPKRHPHPYSVNDYRLFRPPLSIFEQERRDREAAYEAGIVIRKKAS